MFLPFYTLITTLLQGMVAAPALPVASILMLSSSISAPKSLPNSQIAPRKVVEWLTERDHDFGKMRHERPKSFVFLFKNISEEPILLETVRTTCGCTAARWTESPIGPGETGEINVEYDAYQRGDFSKKIRVFFSRQRKPELLWIRGDVD